MPKKRGLQCGAACHVSCPATSSKRSSCPAWAALSWFRVGGYCWWSRNLQLTSSGWEKFPVFTIVWDTFQEIPGGCFLVWDFWTINSMTVRRFSNDLIMHTCDVVLFLLKSWKANKIRRCVSKCPCLYQCYFRHGKLFHNLPTSQPGHHKPQPSDLINLSMGSTFTSFPVKTAMKPCNLGETIMRESPKGQRWVAKWICDIWYIYIYVPVYRSI